MRVAPRGRVVGMRTTIDFLETLLANAIERALEARVALSEVVRDALR